MRTIVSITVGITLLAASTLAAEPLATDIMAESRALAQSAIFTNPPSPTETLAGADVSSAVVPVAANYWAAPVDDAEILMEDLRNEMRGLVWSKGDVKIVPYGYLWGSLIYNTERVNPGAYTLWVYSPDAEGEEAFTIDTRRTRIGVDILGPAVPAFGCAKIDGKIEIDFHGAFVIENKPGVLLRHAYGEIKNDDFRLLAGQTWDVIAPLYPGTLSYSVLWAQGNIGYRRAQVRLERYLHLHGDRLLTVQGSVNQNIVSDFTATAGVDPESSGWPLLQGRVAVTDNSPGSLAGPATLGFSGHIGETGFDFTAVGPAPLFLPPQDDARVRTWSLNADLRVPITKQTGFQGEFFYGENLSSFLGGIVQGVCPCTREGVRSRGGWLEIWHDWNRCWHTSVGYGVDDPHDLDMYFGRTYNSVIYGNLTHDITTNLVVGAEVSVAKTTYRETRVGTDVPAGGESVGIELTGRYAF